jgi:hydrogenase maturation protease
MHRDPGSWMSFEPGQVVLHSSDLHQIGTLHAAGLAEALQLSEALGSMPAHVLIGGIQPEDTGWEPGLTKAVRHAVPAACQATLESIDVPQGPSDHKDVTDHGQDPDH